MVQGDEATRVSWSDASGSKPEREADQDTVAPGTRIGRYEVRTTLGRGGMGVVLLARDEQLQRYVAIKLVRGRSRARAGDTVARDRLLREAQAMAALSHPNVITVHDVGTFGDRVFVAMEHIRGATLSIWLEERKRSVADIVAVFVAAGRGLAAAHDAGIVHRDFKPDNVMVADPEGGDAAFGRVLVLDFGLARPVDASASAGDPHSSAVGSTTAESNPGLTRPGWVVGTPSYMAPEQHHGDSSPAADQYSYCVALFEALYGRRPFRGRSLDDLARAKRGTDPSFPEDPAVPRALREIVRGGLAPEPDARFASMHDIVDALEGGPRRRARRRWVLGSVALVAIAGGSLAAVTGHDAGDPCPAASLDGAWDESRRDTVEASLRAGPAAFAGDTTTTVLAALDVYAQDLVDARGRVCRASRVDGTQTGAELDARMACLDDRRRELAAVSGVLGEATPDTIQHAVDTARGLPEISGCEALAADTDASAARMDAAKAAQLSAMSDLLSRARALVKSGRYDDAETALAWLGEPIASLSWPALSAELHELRATLLQKTGKYEPAAEAYLTALDEAAEADDDARAVQAWDGLTFTVGHSLAQYDRADGYLRHYEAAVVRLGSPPPLEAQRQTTLGILAHDQGQFDASREHFERALELRAASEDEGELADLLVNLARTLSAQGEHAVARKKVERAIEALEQRYGRAHPQVAKTITYLGALDFEAGDVDSAKDNYERALQIQTAAFGDDHPEVAFSLNNIANVQGTKGELPQALANYTKARAIVEAKMGAEHPNVARLTFNMAELHKQLGDFDKSKTEYRRSIDLMEKAFGPDHPEVGRALNNLASVEYDGGEYESSLQHYAASLNVVEKAMGSDYSGLGYPLTGLGLVYLATDRPSEAIDPLERSLRLRVGEDVDPVDRADTQYALARARWQTGELTRAHTLVHAAIDAYEHAAPGVRTNLDEANAWLRSHPLP